MNLNLFSSNNHEQTYEPRVAILALPLQATDFEEQ
jgi:hypothetical protein